MVGRADIVSIAIGANELSLCRSMAEMSCIGGVSGIRAEDRQSMLMEDQIIGQVCSLAGCKYFTGSVRDYRLSRWYANMHPHLGDGGSDIPGANIDIKGSLMRGSQDPLTYRLPVRPREMHDGWIYVLALLRDSRAMVDLVGWASTMMFPEPETEGIFQGAHTLMAKGLNPLMPLRWF